jgi:hypothetical protein
VRLPLGPPPVLQCPDHCVHATWPPRRDAAMAASIRFHSAQRFGTHPWMLPTNRPAYSTLPDHRAILTSIHDRGPPVRLASWRDVGSCGSPAVGSTATNPAGGSIVPDLRFELPVRSPRAVNPRSTTMSKTWLCLRAGPKSTRWFFRFSSASCFRGASAT